MSGSQPVPSPIQNASGGSAQAAGPRLVFFTGGTALRHVSQCLTSYTYNSVHLVTPFDSGGSTAALRRAFAMPAVGDIRNRLLALADSREVPESVLHCCTRRLPAEGQRDELRAELRRMGEPGHRLWQHLPEEFAAPLQLHLHYFLERMPRDFDARLACVGNLMLAGGYLHHRRDFAPVLAFFSRLFRVRGIVQPIVDESLHLAAELVDGSILVGQHRFRRLPCAVHRLFLTVHEPDGPATAPQTSCRPRVSPTAAIYLRRAGAICYPMGSFYTSVLANLLPQGVGQAVAEARCPRIFIPNSGLDDELHGLSVMGQVRLLLRHLREDAPQARTEDLLQAVLVDSRHGRYEGGMGPHVQQELEALGLRVLDRELVCESSAQQHQPELTARALLQAVAPSASPVMSNPVVSNPLVPSPVRPECGLRQSGAAGPALWEPAAELAGTAPRMPDAGVSGSAAAAVAETAPAEAGPVPRDSVLTGIVAKGSALREAPLPHPVVTAPAGAGSTAGRAAPAAQKKSSAASGETAREP